MDVDAMLDICTAAGSCPHDFRPTSRFTTADVDSNEEMMQTSSDAIDISQT